MTGPDRCSMASYDWANGGLVGSFFRHGMVSGLRGSQCYSREWVWNLRIKLCWMVVGKYFVSKAPLLEFYVGYIDF